MHTKKGFTLIELLVVIAIIGMMSSIVLASLNSARAKAADAAIKADLSNIRAQAAIYFDNNGTYGTATSCLVTSGSMTSAGPPCNGLLTDAVFVRGVYAAIASSGSTGWANIADTPLPAWAVSVPLKTSGLGHWCVDSTGASKLEPAGLGALTACP